MQKKTFDRIKPFLAVVFLQFGLAGMDVLSKAALNHGMSNYVLVVYRHVVATLVIAPFAVILDKKVRPKMTVPIFTKLLVLSFLEPVIDQNLFLLGMKYTTATFASALINVLPAIAFLMAWFLRLEKVKLKSIRSQAKVVGTLATVAGAMVITLVKGPVLELIWTKGKTNHDQHNNGTNLHHSIKGAVMITIGCFSWACFVNLQAITLKTYPAELSLTAWICLLGSIEGTIVALVMERGKAAIWAISWDVKLWATLYSGIMGSGLTYYIQGVVMQDRGPVFVTAFNPLCMVIVAIMGSFVLSEQLYLGRILGAIIIVAGLYLVVWGKSKDYESSTSPIDEKTAPDKQITQAGSTGNKKSNHESTAKDSTTIDVSGGEIVTRDEQVHEQRSPITVWSMTPSQT